MVKIQHSETTNMTFCFLNWQILSRKARNSQQVCAVLPVDVEELKELNLSLRFGAETGWSLLDGLVSCGPNEAADRKGRINLSNESDNNHRWGLNTFYVGSEMFYVALMCWWHCGRRLQIIWRGMRCKCINVTSPNKSFSSANWLSDR